MTRYTEPTAQQLEEARALIFLAATKRELRHSEHIWDLTLEIEVEHTVHNQRQYLIHAARGTQSIAGRKAITSIPQAALRTRQHGAFVATP